MIAKMSKDFLIFQDGNLFNYPSALRTLIGLSTFVNKLTNK